MPIDTVRMKMPVTYYHLDAILHKFAYISSVIIANNCSSENMAELEESLQQELIASLQTILSSSNMYYGIQISNDEKKRSYIVGDVIDKMVIAFDDFVLNSQLDTDTKLAMITDMHVKSIPMRITYEEYNPDLKDHIRRQHEAEEVNGESENDSDGEWDSEG